VAGAWPTPAYVYDVDRMIARVAELRRAFAGRFDVSYAVKANPNRALLAALGPHIQNFDVSSFAEVERVRAAWPDLPISFTGPGKRDEELHRFAALGAGHLVLESLDEAESLSEIVLRHGLPEQAVLLRVNPQQVRRQFGANMGSRSSQFGIDEEDLPATLGALAGLPGLRVAGFHCYPATNGLKAAAGAENLAMMCELFRRCAALAGTAPEHLVFGAGFGIPYFEDEAELDLDALAAATNPQLDALRAVPGFAATRFVLELGRWIVGPAGYLLTTVIRTKASRGNAIRICDAGFNAHMAACGMLGGAFRRNWRIRNITNPEGEPETVDLVGPLCTTLDHVASGVALPAARKGDVLAILQSGAYGITASPTRFISHPEPIELAVTGGEVRDVTESRANWWAKLPEAAQ
jgi:diaminopimelate decarboxylase